MTTVVPVVTLRIERVVAGDERANCWVLSTTEGDAVIVDPGGESARIDALLRSAALRPVSVVATHGHADHIGAAADILATWDVPLILHQGDEPTLRRANLLRIAGRRPPVQMPAVTRWLVASRESLSLGGTTLRLLHTPGHTPGGVSIHVTDEHDRGHLFTGDTLFRGAVGRTDLPGGDLEALERSLRMLATFAPDTVVHPGHGDETAIGAELGENGAFRRLVR